MIKRKREKKTGKKRIEQRQEIGVENSLAIREKKMELAYMYPFVATS